MRQTHIGGDKLFVDGACPRAGHKPDPWAGDTVPGIVDRLTGRIRPAQILSPSWALRTSPEPVLGPAASRTVGRGELEPGAR